MPSPTGYIIDQIKKPTSKQLSDIVKDRTKAGAITEGRKKRKRKLSPLEGSDRRHERRRKLPSMPEGKPHKIKKRSEDMFKELDR